ncbi:Cytochrome P450 monooxygenase pvhE [Exophiala dermatitidis]
MILQFLSWQYLLLFSYLAFVAYVYIRRDNKRKEVLKLGGECPRITTRFIFGLDFLIHSTRAMLKNQAVEFWEWMYQDTGTGDGGTRSYTAELHILADIRVVFTSDPENIKAILATQFHDFGKGEAFHEEWKPFLGDGIFTTDGQQWHDSRQLIRPMFVRERVADLPLIEKHVRKLISLMGAGDGQMVMLNKLLSRFSLDASTDFLFGHSVGSLDKEQSEFAMAFDEVQRLQTLQERLGPLKLFYPMHSYRAGIKTMERFIEPFITEALSMTESKLSGSDTFIHALARYTRDRKVVRDQLVALLLAGRDTTASTLSWLFLELAKNPQVVETLRAEIFEYLGKDGRPPTYQEIKDMKYLTYTINETLRLYPVVPFNVRSALTDTTLPHGAGPDGMSPVGCPRGTVVGYSTIGMQRRRDLYPPISESFPYDPADWVPDRWATWTPKPWHFIPFNGGPRICIGQQFAMVEMAYTVVRILQEFDHIVDYGSPRILHAEIVLTPAEGVKVGFVKRDKRQQ